MPRLVKAHCIVSAHGNRKMVHAFRSTAAVDRDRFVFIGFRLLAVDDIFVVLTLLKIPGFVIHADEAPSTAGTSFYVSV